MIRVKKEKDENDKRIKLQEELAAKARAEELANQPSYQKGYTQYLDNIKQNLPRGSAVKRKV